MSEVQASAYEGIGRNDTCPCGSGKKFKKCHERELRLQKEASKKTRNVEDLIRPETIPYKVFKILVQLRENNLSPLYYDLMHDSGPLRSRYASAAAFLGAVEGNTDKLPAGHGYDLRWFRVDGPDVTMMLIRGLDDPQQTSLAFEVITLRPNEFDGKRDFREVEHRGWRIWEVQRYDKPKTEENQDVRLADLGYSWAEPWTRPPEADVIEVVDALEESAQETAEA